MKNLVTRLQNEANLSEDQARMAVGIFRDYLIECEDDPDLSETLKVKASHIKKTAKSKYEDWTDQAEELMMKAGESISEAADKAGDKADELLSKAKRKAKVAVDKLSDYLDDDKSK